MPEVAWLNGKFMPLRRARVPVMDRGFLYGDGVYEVIHAAGGVPFLLEEHLRRLAASARKIGLKRPPRELLRRAVAGALKRAGYRESLVYIQVTRGAAYPRSHVPSPGTKPTVLVAVWRLKERPEAYFTRGVACITMEDFRWGRCDVKSLNLLANCMGVTRARRRGAAEVIFVSRGRLVEGGMSAVFVVRRGGLIVPKLSPRILPSITRRLVLEVAPRLGLPARQRPVTVREMLAADEVFLASTTAEGLPVVKIDGRRIGSGRPGPVTTAVRAEILRRERRGGVRK